MKKRRLLRLLGLALLLLGAGAGVFLSVSCARLTPYEEITAQLAPERLVPVNGRSVHVVVDGMGEETIVLLHGFAASTYSFHELAPRLSGTFRIIAIDLNGFGYTERPPDPEAYTIEGQAETVLAVADALGLERFHLVGHSYGAAVAIRLSHAAPHRCGKLVLVSPAPEAEKPPAFWTSPAGRALGYGLMRAVLSRPKTFRDILAEAYHREEVLTPEVSDAYRQRLLVEGLPDAFRGFSRAMTARAGLDLRLGEIDRPVLVVAGKHDSIVPVGWCREVAETVPQGKLVVLEDSGHSAPEEQPDRLAQSMRTFLGKP